MDTENVLFEIVVGTYEKFLLGYYLELNSDVFYLKPSFVTESHLQSVRCIAASSKFLASGSTDEAIQLFNIKTRREIGSLLHHNGTVTSLEFYGSYLMSSSEDKNICIWSTNNWQCIKTLSGHKKSVNCISIHPSGKMALSVSKDKTLRTWNLIKGRSAYVTNIKKEAELVKWSPDGSVFVIACSTFLDVYSVDNASVLHTINFQHKICDVTFIKDNLCAVAGESEDVNIYDTTTGSLAHEFKAHNSRIKALKSITVNDESFLITTSSDGYVKVWHTDVSDGLCKNWIHQTFQSHVICSVCTTLLKESNFNIRKVAKVKTGSRPTCMAVIPA